MKNFQVTLLATILGVGILQAQITETPATIALTTGANPQGFIQNSRPGAILFATAQGGAGRAVPLTEIRGEGLEKLIRLEERGEVLANARAAFAEGKYAEAAQEFGRVADAYGIVIHIPQNFACEARFYQIESLRRMGQFKDIASLLETPAGKNIDTMLSDRYKKSSEFHKLWAIYGQGDMAKLEEALKRYQEPVTGKAGLLPTANFKKAPQNDLVQLAFLRGEVHDKKGERDKALQDFTRVFTLTFANEPFLSKQAMGKTMVIMSENPALKSENEKKRKGPEEHMQSIAYFFSKRFPETPIPPPVPEIRRPTQRGSPRRQEGGAGRRSSRRRQGRRKRRRQG